MKNFNTQDISKIKSYINNTLHVINQGVQWTEDYLKFEEKNKVVLDLKHSTNTLQRIHRSIDEKPVIAVFGASQVGKSYLIKNLLSTEDHPLEIIHDGKRYDFLQEINPPGNGAESTGVVTRFTIDKSSFCNENLVEIKLLSVKDLLITLLDTYFLDQRKIQKPFESFVLDERLKVFEDSTTDIAQNYLTEYDILEVKSYIDNHLQKHSLLFESLNSIHYFERVSKIIEETTFDQWKLIFGELWHQNSEITQLFDHLVGAILAHDLKDRVYAPFDVILRGGGELLDVLRLKEIFGHQTVQIQSQDNRSISIGLGVLAALTKELVFVIPEELKEEKAFLDNSDLLDFPGARSRLTLNFEDINIDTIGDMFLRGKVSYLFNKYSDNFNINNLLYCTNDKQLDVNELPFILESWIHSNIGFTVQQRTETLQGIECPPLFMIYTFFNNQLKYDLTNDIHFNEDVNTLAYKWDLRFKRFFKNEIITPTRDWDVNWTLNTPNFNNMYVLRDYKYSTDTFEGFEEDGKEHSLRSDRQTFVSAMKQTFINYDFVQQHFKNPEKTWEGAVNVGRNGSRTIIENLNTVSSNYSKVKYYIGKINEVVSHTKEILTKYLHVDDIEQLRVERMHAVNSFQFSFNALIVKDHDAFEQFLSRLTLTPVSIYNLLNEYVVVDTNEERSNQIDENNILLTTYPALKEVQSQEEAMSILKKALWLNSDEEVEQFLQSKGISTKNIFSKEKPKSKAELYVVKVLNTWKEKIHEMNSFTYFVSNGIQQSDIAFITNHLEEILHSRNLEEQLVKITNEVTSETRINHGVEDFLAETISAVINDFVINMDLNYIDEATFNELNNSIQISFNHYGNKPNQVDLTTLFSSKLLIDAKEILLKKYNTWLEKLRISLLVNSGFAQYDEVANSQLNTIVNNIENLSIHA